MYFNCNCSRFNPKNSTSKNFRQHIKSIFFLKINKNQIRLTKKELIF
ncbi:hypothetical protein [Flavobacterium sp.]